MSRWNKLLFAAVWATLLGGIALACTITFWYIAPYRGLYDVPQPFPFTENPVEVGRLASYKVSYCVDESLPIPIAVQRELELQGPNELIFTLAPPTEYLIKSRCETRVLSFGIPTYIPPGTYHLHFITALKVNPVRVVYQSFQSENLQVVPSCDLLEKAKVAASLVEDTAKKAATALKK